MQIYIHIPFCDLKCKYCRFASVGKIQNLHINKYVSFLCDEIKSSPPTPLLKGEGSMIVLDTIYFGGGTPSVLSKQNLKDIFDALKSRFIFFEDIEITLESTPNNITLENLKIWEKFGINRLSIGVQTLNQKSLEEIGRGKKGDLEICFENLKTKILSPTHHPGGPSLEQSSIHLDLLLGEGSISNISLDFIIGLPYVKKGEILDNIKYVLDNYDFVKHISVYMLEEYYNPDKIIETKYDNITYPESWNKLGLKDEEYLEEYSNIKKYLIEKGFKNYEISNFAKSGFLCKHNKGYWEHKEVLAFGMGAGGFIKEPPSPLIRGNKPFSIPLSGGDRTPQPPCQGELESISQFVRGNNLNGKHKKFIRYLNADNFKDYYAGKKIFEEKLDKNDLFLEKVMFGLRTKGLKKEIYEKLNQEKINYFIKNGYLIKKMSTEGFNPLKDKNIIKLTDKGVLVLDYILGEIIL